MSPAAAVQASQEPFDLVVSELVPGDELRIVDVCRRATPRVPLSFSLPAATNSGPPNQSNAAPSTTIKTAARLPERPGRALLATAGQAARSAAANGHTKHREQAENGRGQNGHVNGQAAISADDLQAYCRILNALPVHLAMLDEQGVIRTANDAWRQYPLGVLYQNHEHLEGTDYLAVCDAAVEQGQEQAQAIADGLRRVLAGKCSTFGVEYPCQTEGVQRWFKLAASPLRDDKHRGAMIAHVDITDRKQAELERDQLFEQSLSLLCIGGFDGHMRRWSRSVQVLGYQPNELVKLSLWTLLHPDDRELASVMGDQLRAGEMVSTTEMRVRSKDGSYRWILWDAVPCLEQDLFFATGQDITDRKVIEQQLHDSH